MSSDVETDDTSEGYKRVQLGPREATLPKEWEISPVRELFEIKKESFDPSQLDSESEVMLYSMPAYDSNRDPIQTSVSEIGSKKYRVPENTILFPKLNIRKRRFWRVQQAHSLPAVCSTEYWPLVPKTPISLDFYHYYFDSYEFMSNPKVTSSSSTNSHKRVKQSSFEKLRLPIPPLPEQRRVAEILSTVDEQIQQTDEIIETTRELKRALVQDLIFSGIEREATEQIHIGPKPVQIAESWETKQIGDVTSTVQYGCSESLSQQGEYPMFRMNNIEDGRMVAEPMKYVDLDDGTAEKYRVETNDILFNRTNSIDLVGKAGIFDLDEEFVFASYLIRLQTNEQMNPWFLNYLINSKIGQDVMFSIATRGASQANINATNLKNVKIPVPPREEQDEIVERIRTVEEKLDKEQQKKDCLQELKRGLMQDLLTGKVRVNTGN